VCDMTTTAPAVQQSMQTNCSTRCIHVHTVWYKAVQRSALYYTERRALHHGTVPAPDQPAGRMLLPLQQWMLRCIIHDAPPPPAHTHQLRCMILTSPSPSSHQHAVPVFVAVLPAGHSAFLCNKGCCVALFMIPPTSILPPPPLLIACCATARCPTSCPQPYLTVTG
jgi:hypothetical protein